MYSTCLQDWGIIGSGKGHSRICGNQRKTVLDLRSQGLKFKGALASAEKDRLAFFRCSGPFSLCADFLLSEAVGEVTWVLEPDTEPQVQNVSKCLWAKVRSERFNISSRLLKIQRIPLISPRFALWLHLPSRRSLTRSCSGVRQQQETKKSKNFLRAARTLILSSMRHLNDFNSYHLFIGLSNLIFASSVKGLSLLLAPVFKR